MASNTSQRRDVIRCNTKALDIAMRLGQWTNVNLSRITGLSTGTIGNLRGGARTTCNVETAVAIEKALRLKPGDIFVREVLITDSAA